MKEGLFLLDKGEAEPMLAATVNNQSFLDTSMKDLAEIRSAYEQKFWARFGYNPTCNYSSELNAYFASKGENKGVLANLTKRKFDLEAGGIKEPLPEQVRNIINDPKYLHSSLKRAVEAGRKGNESVQTAFKEIDKYCRESCLKEVKNRRLTKKAKEGIKQY